MNKLQVIKDILRSYNIFDTTIANAIYNGASGTIKDNLGHFHTYSDIRVKADRIMDILRRVY